jgi:GT2 family glycosyltransferase
VKEIKKIAVLLTCHNRKDKTLTCLEALFKSALPAGYLLEVFLVDDGSTDGTSKAVHESYPQVNIIKGDGNLFWNRGMHTAWETAAKTEEFDYYLWLNDDTYVFRNALEIMLSSGDSTNNQAIIVGASCSKISDELTYSGFLTSGEKIKPTNELVQAHMFHGNCILVPKHVFQRVGNLDPLFHHAIGDMDYGLRAIKLGIKSLIAPGFLANCESNTATVAWCLKSVPLKTRIKALYSPLCKSQPYYFFRFALRHFGLLMALKHFFSIHLRLLMPALWKYCKNSLSSK